MPNLLCCTMQGASGLTLAARLNQQALLPDMMFPTVNRFNPDNGQPLPTSNGTLLRALLALLYRGTPASLLDSAHQELDMCCLSSEGSMIQD